MRPQVGKRANAYKAPKEEFKTQARQFVENRQKYNMATREDYLVIRDVAVAININALEQRILAKLNILKMVKKGYTKEKLTEMIEKDIELDRPPAFEELWSEVINDLRFTIYGLRFTIYGLRFTGGQGAIVVILSAVYGTKDLSQ